MRITLIISMCILLVLPNVGAQTSDSSRLTTTCAPPFPVTATSNIVAGYINFCVSYPDIAATSTSTFQVISTLTAPATTLPVFQSTASAFVINSGCTEGTTVLVVPSTNGVIGTMATYGTIFTMTSEQCDASASVSLTIGTPPLLVYSTALPITVQTENRRIDNFNYLCDAPGIAPNAYSTTTTTCTDPNLLMTCTGCNDTVSIGDTDVFVNVTTNITTGNQTGNQTVETPGFDGSLYVLLTAIGIAFAHLGTIHKTNGGRIIGGGFLFAASLAIFRELERLGFTHMEESTIDMALLVMAIQWIAAIYLFIPKNYEEKEETNE